MRSAIGTIAGLSVLAGGLLLGCTSGGATAETQDASLPFGKMAARIVAALQPEAGERVMIRNAPGWMDGLGEELRSQLENAGASGDLHPYGPVEDLAAQLAETGAYVVLPAPSQPAAPAEQTALVIRWLMRDRHRMIHFHWADGTRAIDGVWGVHNEAYDRVYLDALDVPPGDLNRQMEAAIAALRSGEVRVTTPGGTDLRFRVGDRPFTKQTGDASAQAMEGTTLTIQREIELPAGALRVAPLEESVNGTLVIPWARAMPGDVEGIRLTIENGVVTGATAERQQEAWLRYLDSDPALRRFREFGLGFNPKLVQPEGERWIPYYGYGAGVVRLSLGDNTELGGAVRGGAVRWLLFPDATVVAGDKVLVENGKLSPDF